MSEIPIISKPTADSAVATPAGNAKPANFPDDNSDFHDDGPIENMGLMKPYHGTTGFVPVGRAAFNSSLFQNRDYAHFFWLMDLYEQACFTEGKPYAPATTIPVPIKPGQVMTSWNILKKRWGLKSDKPVRAFLAKAEAEGLIVQERVLADGARMSTNGARSGGTTDYTKKVICTVITICHYIINKKEKEPKDGKLG